jgi:hypothetical protein
MTPPRPGFLLAAGFAALAGAAIVAGIVLIGGPSTQRDIALDRTRAGDLTRLSLKVADHWRERGHLPKSLQAIDDAWARIARDPETDQPYDYAVTGERTWRLCADFARAATKPPDYPGQAPFGVHDKGRVCFEQKIGPAPFDRPVPAR